MAKISEVKQTSKDIRQLLAKWILTTQGLLKPEHWDTTIIPDAQAKRLVEEYEDAIPV